MAKEELGCIRPLRFQNPNTDRVVDPQDYSEMKQVRFLIEPFGNSQTTFMIPPSSKLLLHKRLCDKSKDFLRLPGKLRHKRLLLY